MAWILFHSIDSLIQALKLGVVPSVIAHRPVQACFVGVTVTLEAALAMAENVLADLVQAGATIVEPVHGQAIESLMSWAQAIALVRSDQSGRMLIQLGHARRLSRWLAELRRFQCSDVSWCIDERGEAWLLVPKPTAALKFRAESEEGATAYMEQSPNVWVELGWQHPLSTPYVPARDRSLLLRPVRDWQMVSTWAWQPVERHFVMEGEAPAIQAQDVEPVITVTPRLKPAREPAAAEFWVVAHEASLQRWLSTADDRLVDRLDAARVQTEASTALVLWARGGRTGPPVLLLDAEPYQAYLKLPSLFVPLGMQLAPLLRRDVAKRWLTVNSEQLTWFDRLGRLQSVAIHGFRPLREWVDYVRPLGRSCSVQKPDPIFSIEPFEVKDRPSGEQIELMGGSTAGGQSIVMTWDGHQWRFAPRTSA